MPSSRLALLPTLLLLLHLVPLSHALISSEDFSFDLRAGAQQCFTQRFPPRTPSVVDILVVDGPPGVAVGVTIVEVSRNVLIHSVDYASRETLSVDARASGPDGVGVRDGAPTEVRVCLIGKRPYGWTRPMDHDRAPRAGDVRKVFVTMHEAGDGSSSSGSSSKAGDKSGLLELPTKRDLGGIKETVDEMGRQIMRLSREIEYLRRREGDLATTADASARRIVRCSVLAALFIVVSGVMSTAGMQSVLKKNAR